MRRILFVDDDQQVLDGLRDLLRRQRREWHMVFALGGPAALSELDASEPFDVVVSDMRMPDIDGATLLGLVQQRSPQTARIVLSGQTDMKATLRAVPVAHRFLAKPCDREQLLEAIERASAAPEVLAARRAAGGAEALPSAPTLYTRLVEASEDPDITMEDIGALVETDIAMSAKVLQLVNSSFFGISRRISSAREAVVYLGIAPLRALVLSIGAFRAFAPAHRISGFSVERLEARSMVVAAVAAELAPDKTTAADAFTAGVLHDIGQLVLAAQQPRDLEALLAEADSSDKPLHTIELQRGGTTHAELGGYLLGLWGLPDQIVAAVTRHHDPPGPNAEPDPSAVVHVADALVPQHGAAPAPVDAALVERLGLAGRLEAAVQLAAGHTA